VRPSLEAAKIQFRVFILNDKTFGVAGAPRAGTLLFCLSNARGVAIVDSVVRA
jgi:hypothetical protein